MFKVPEKYRIKEYSSEKDGNNGVFFIPRFGLNTSLKVIASDGLDWEHVSVSLPDRCPTWDEMCRIKDLFWDDEDIIMQLHPSKSQYVNNVSNCLHLWRPVIDQIPVPDSIMVGIKGINLS